MASIYSNTIKMLMDRESLSTWELSSKCGLPFNTLKNIVNGTRKKPHQRVLKIIAKVFGLSLIELKMLAKGDNDEH